MSEGGPVTPGMSYWVVGERGHELVTLHAGEVILPRDWGATDPITPTDENDPVPPEEAEETEVGAFMGDRPAEPVEWPDPEQ